ncbi:MAG: hypothetical protein CMK53_05330 [Proteobacteria bacterium]|nr:hypothetical protein [Deltaproteobacteria bacterium]MAE00041.1 hypothetical protein [Pseudomonadota bacterium]MBI14496.1 hypothetical protein [Deltaproteobacteria bacterium]HCP36054.1 hypothetical protein [Deltaproteobacteria bacterium]
MSRIFSGSTFSERETAGILYQDCAWVWCQTPPGFFRIETVDQGSSLFRLPLKRFRGSVLAPVQN